MNELIVQESESLEDPEWDRFLESSPLGHYQQSTSWARCKQVEGWACIRVTLKSEQSIIGGFQILWRKSRFGAIAYLSKGPVLDESFGEHWEYMLGLVGSTARRRSLRALIQQLPDRESSHVGELFSNSGYVACSFMGVVACTYLVDTNKTVEDVASGYRSSTRNSRNKGSRAGLKGSWGSRSDLSEFFRLMLHTCERQGVAPNPSSEESLYGLWDGFSVGGGEARLRFTHLEGELLCADLLVLFGSRLTLFKTGWTGEANHLRPKSFQTCEILEWASENGFEYADFSSFDRDLAEVMLQGGEISADLRKRRDFFKSNFGGKPVLLPSAAIWIPNRFLRFAFTLLAKRSVFGRMLRRLSA